MADPILTDHRRALAIFHGQTGLPHDVYVNSWAFRYDGTIFTDPVGSHTAIVNVLTAFYTGMNGAATRTITSFMPGQLLLPTLEIRTYDLGQEPPREPQISTVDLTDLGTGVPLPEEVALCLSMYADRNLPRQRGRLYLGPFTVGAVNFNAQGVTPQADLRRAVSESAVNVLNSTENVEWAIVSGADAQSRLVTAGWVDDAFDTQRRRGKEATDRYTWNGNGVTVPA